MHFRYSLASKKVSITEYQLRETAHYQVRKEYKMNMRDYGFDYLNLSNESRAIPARIVASHRNRFEIICESGSGLAQVKTSEYQRGGEEYPTTGDFVLLEWGGESESRIVKTLPRKTYFSRRDPSSAGHREQAIAANFDYVFIVQGLDRDFNERRLERYLTLAWHSGAIPVVVLTKADTIDDPEPFLRAARQISPHTGVFAVSSLTGFGFDELDEYLEPGKTVVLLGSSGVGKSSLVNALAGGTLMKTGSVREKDGRGRHTTTCRQLHRLPCGAMLIDTPGMRELGIGDGAEALDRSFSDVEHYLGSCKFSDCQHLSEPGCAIKEALQRGDLSPERWESYLKLKAEARLNEDKEGFLRDKARWEKEISKMVRKLK